MKWYDQPGSLQHFAESAVRGYKMAMTEPRGPVYLVGPREVMEEAVPPSAVDPAEWTAVAPLALPPDEVRGLADALARAHRPLPSARSARRGRTRR